MVIPSPRHVFLSYVREDAKLVEVLESRLQAAGIETWRDTKDIGAGTRWRQAIRKAIQDGASFIACFSSQSEAKDRSYMRKEIIVAAEELQLRPRSRAWFFPVKLSPCDIEPVPIGAGETLADLQHIELYEDFEKQIASLINAVRVALGRSYPIRVADWRPFSWRVSGAGNDVPVLAIGSTVTIAAPEGDYGGLFGAASAEEFCDNTFAAEFALEPPRSESPGYGVAFAPRGALAAGAPVGWSLQIEWDAANYRYQARSATMPTGAWLGPTGGHPATRLELSAGEWYSVRITLVHRRAAATIAGQPLPAFVVPGGCGSPLVRAWGSRVSVREVTILRPDEIDNLATSTPLTSPD